MADEFTATQAADALGAFTRVFRAAEHLHKAASWAANMEQVQAELTAAVRSEREALVLAQADTAQAKDEAAAERAKTKDAAARAKDKAEKLVADAEAKALELTSTAEATAAKAHEDADAANARAQAADAAVLLASEELAAINAKIAEARETIAKLLGTAA